MIRPGVLEHKKKAFPFTGCLFVISFISTVFSLLILSGCASDINGSAKSIENAVISTDARLIKYHVEENLKSLEELTRRLYLKNPKYEKDNKIRKQKITAIFHGGPPLESVYSNRPSHEVLTAAFDNETLYTDRVYLLSLGLAKSIKEAYELEDVLFISGLQIPIERINKLYLNVRQVKWRLKTYRDKDGKLLFLTNETGEEGYMNMGYEVILTKILTRLEDDIYLLGGLPQKMFFNMTTIFFSILS